MKKALRLLALSSPQRNAKQIKSLTAEMQLLKRERGELSIAQVGANDGKFGDPIYNFLLANKESTRIILIEPQAILIPFLKENYSDHPNYVISNTAIGAPGDLKIYSINSDLWPAVRAAVKKPNWPLYRAATGVTSSNRLHVERWIKRKLDIQNVSSRHITENNVHCMTLDAAIDEAGFARPIDVLQIDVEGLDDEVIYNSISDTLKPLIIHFEHQHLTFLKCLRLRGFLTNNGYKLKSFKTDTIAVLS